MKEITRISLRWLFALSMVVSLVAGGSYAAVAQDTTSPSSEVEESATPDQPVIPEEPGDNEDNEGTPSDGDNGADDSIVQPTREGNGEGDPEFRSLNEPLAAVPGTFISLESTEPITCNAAEWAFRIRQGDASIQTVTVEFANGNVVSLSFAGSAAVKTATTRTNLDSTVVSATTHSSVVESTAILEVLRGPCNADPDDQLHSATINVLPADDVAGVEWTLTNSAGDLVASGVLDESGVIEVAELPASGYSVNTADPSGTFLSGSVSFSVVNDDVTANLTLVRAAVEGWIQFQVSERGGPRIPGASVTLTNANGDLVIADETNAQGILQVDNVPGGWYHLTVSAEGFTTQNDTFEFRSSSHVHGVALDRVSVNTVTGFVADAQTQEGIPGATVTIVGTASSGTTNADGVYVLDDVPGGYWDATFSAPGYRPITLRAVVTSPEITLNAILVPANTMPITLSVVTSDDGSPEGALFEAVSGETTFAGVLDATGQVFIGDLSVGDSYEVSINGEPAGYLAETATFTVTRGESVWEIVIDPIPTETVSLVVTTSDEGSPEGATFVITEAPDEEASGDFSTLALTDTPITGTLPASGIIEVGDLAIGRSYTVAINGAPAGYQDAFGTFTVEVGDNTWELVLQAIPDEPTETPTVPVDPKPTQPSDDDDADPTSTAVTGLPSTGAGNGTMGGAITLIATGTMLLAMLGLSVNRIQRNRVN